MKKFDNDQERTAYLQNMVSLANYYIYERQLNLVLRIKSVFLAPSKADELLRWDLRDRSDCKFDSDEPSRLLQGFGLWEPPGGNDALSYFVVSDCYPDGGGTTGVIIIIKKSGVVSGWWIFPLIMTSFGSPHVPRAHMGVYRTCGARPPHEGELTPAHGCLNTTIDHVNQKTKNGVTAGGHTGRGDVQERQGRAVRYRVRGRHQVQVHEPRPRVRPLRERRGGVGRVEHVRTRARPPAQREAPVGGRQLQEG